MYQNCISKLFVSKFISIIHIDIYNTLVKHTHIHTISQNCCYWLPNRLYGIFGLTHKYMDIYSK